MNIIEKINYFADNSSKIKFLRQNYVNIQKLSDEIKRYICKALNDKNLPIFMAQDLRHLVINLNKGLKLVNKKIEFVSIKDRFKKFDKITDVEFSEVMTNLCEYMTIAKYLQESYSILNYLAVTLELHEMQINNESAESVFNDAILEVLIQAKKGL